MAVSLDRSLTGSWQELDRASFSGQELDSIWTGFGQTLYLDRVWTIVGQTLDNNWTIADLLSKSCPTTHREPAPMFPPCKRVVHAMLCHGANSAWARAHVVRAVSALQWMEWSGLAAAAVIAVLDVIKVEHRGLHPQLQTKLVVANNNTRRHGHGPLTKATNVVREGGFPSILGRDI